MSLLFKKPQTSCIVIPIYQSFGKLTLPVLQSICQAFKILNKHHIYFIAPNNLNIADYTSFFPHAGFSFQWVSFDAEYFDSIQGYNRLLLSPFFYEAFSQYDYMLIYQTDAWIFRDELDCWCNKGYDYIGAPFVNWEWSTFYARHLTFPRRQLYRMGYRNFNLVGNGGLSLRNVQACITNLRFFQHAAKRFSLNEDYFFSFYINSYNPFFKVAPFQEALQFSFDENPAASFELNRHALPMGCHAWPKYQDFWKDYIPFETTI